MQVQHTVTFDDELRFGVAQSLTGQFRLATRDECREWLDQATALPLAQLRSKVQNAAAAFVPSKTGTHPLESTGQGRSDA